VAHSTSRIRGTLSALLKKIVRSLDSDMHYQILLKFGMLMHLESPQTVLEMACVIMLHVQDHSRSLILVPVESSIILTYILSHIFFSCCAVLVKLLPNFIALVLANLCKYCDKSYTAKN